MSKLKLNIKNNVKYYKSPGGPFIMFFIIRRIVILYKTITRLHNNV